jgi:predicted DNA-binding transcriptional regulator AlpA
MRKVRGAKSLSSYLESLGCPMSESTIYRLMRTHGIPFRRPTAQILIFDLDEIDKWLGSECEAKQSQ